MDKILSLLYFHKLKKIELSVCDLSIPKVSKFYLVLPVIFSWPAMDNTAGDDSF